MDEWFGFDRITSAFIFKSKDVVIWKEQVVLAVGAAFSREIR